MVINRYWSKLVIVFFIIAFNGVIEMKAQERIVDDAAITNLRSFQIETWYGQFESVFMPAIGANQWLELGLGLIFDSETDFNYNGLMPEIKAIKNNFEIDSYSWGGVMGLLLSNDFKINEFYLYSPYSRNLMGGNLVLHINAGFNYVWNTSNELIATYGFRGDLHLFGPFDVLGGMYAENFDLSFYGGSRIAILPDFLEIILTYGQGIIPRFKMPGFAIQLSITPDQLW